MYDNVLYHTLKAILNRRAGGLGIGADIAKVQEWLGHANVSTSRVYDHRKTGPEDSPVFKVKY